MVDTAKTMVANDNTKQLLKDQQQRFVSEVNSLVESLEVLTAARVEARPSLVDSVLKR